MILVAIRPRLRKVATLFPGFCTRHLEFLVRFP